MKNGDTFKENRIQKDTYFYDVAAGSQYRCYFSHEMFGISPGDFVSTMTAVCAATAMKKFGMISRGGFNRAKEGLIR
jgi:hypothetical protein